MMPRSPKAALLAWLALSVLLVPALSRGQAPPDPVPKHYTLLTPLDVHLHSLLDAAVGRGLPGVSLRVTGPWIDFRGAAGAANLATGETLTPEHAMYMASLGKTFTATIALQLCEEGRLDLDSPISIWLPRDISARVPSSDEITLRHLLGHRSGIADYLNDDEAWRRDFVSNPGHRWHNREVASYFRDLPLLFEPGTDFHYSNSNYILAGIIIERVTGRPLRALVRERILEPLDLQHTSHGEKAGQSEQLAHGHVRDSGSHVDTLPWYRHQGLADSGIRGTPDDIARFLRSLLTSEILLSERMRDEMTRAPETSQRPYDYGLGLYVYRNLWGGGPAYAHDGRDPGYEADMLYFPEFDLTIVLAANGSLGRASRIYERLLPAVVQAALHESRTPAYRAERYFREGIYY